MILLIGAGAVGTILAAHLSAAGKEPLKLYARPKDMAALGALRQIRVDPSSAQRPPLLARAPELTPDLNLTGVDYLFICVKYPALETLLEQLPQIPAGCTVVSTLNGTGALRLIRARFPKARVAPMSVMFNGQLPGPLHAHITTRAEVIVGSDDARLLGCFEGSGMKVSRAAGDAAVWGKLLINLANAVCAITHTTFKDLLSQHDLRVIYAAVLDEATALLTRSGHAYQLPIAIPYALYRQLILRGGPIPWWFARAKNGLREGAYPSMVADVEQGRVTEVTQLNGEIAALAREHGLPAPVNTRIVALVQALREHHPPQYLTPAQLRAGLGLGAG